MNPNLKTAALVTIAVALALTIALVAGPKHLAQAQDCAKTYDNFGKAFIEQYCIGCHASANRGFARKGAPEGYNYDDVTIIQNKKKDILKWVIEKKRMPPIGTISDQEKANLKTWLDCEYK